MPAMAHLGLGADEVLSTTRSVRRRLDLERPVDPALIDECLQLAVQAPTSEGHENWHFVVVTDADQRKALGDCYRAAWAGYLNEPPPTEEIPDEPRSRWFARIIHEVPVMVLPCIEGRPEGGSSGDLAALYGSIVQAGWSFQLAARERGLGSVWTTFHLDYEQRAAEALGIPYDRVTQVALIPVAHTRGTDFKPGRRRPMSEVVHHDRW
jgi:nitroreductase